MENKKAKSTTALIVALLIVTIVSLILATFAWARYATNGSGNAVANVAKWNVTVSNDGSTFSKTYQYVVDKRLAPGTSGELKSTLAIGADTEVDVGYQVVVTGVTVEYVDANDTNLSANPVVPAAIPTNMSFEALTTSNSNTYADVTNAIKNFTAGSEYVIASGTVTKTTGLSSEIVPLKWNWPYRTGTDDANNINIVSGDIADTKDGEHPVKITITYRVDAWQIKPVAQ